MDAGKIVVAVWGFLVAWGSLWVMTGWLVEEVKARKKKELEELRWESLPVYKATPIKPITASTITTGTLTAQQIRWTAETLAAAGFSSRDMQAVLRRTGM